MMAMVTDGMTDTKLEEIITFYDTGFEDLRMAKNALGEAETWRTALRACHF